MGGSLDAVLRLSHGPVVPYLIGGVGVTAVHRQADILTTFHSTAAGYDIGVGCRAPVGRVKLFAELRFFATSATAGQFAGHSVQMFPLSIGLAL